MAFTISLRSVRRARIAFTCCVAFVAIGLAYGSVLGMIQPIGRHVGDGALQWIKSSPVCLHSLATAVSVIEIPARGIYLVPGFEQYVSLWTEVWTFLLQAPETTGIF
jgi:hypothetical protein